MSELYEEWLRRAQKLLARMKSVVPELQEMLNKMEACEEHGIYRFYDGSFKVYRLQQAVKDAQPLIQ